MLVAKTQADGGGGGGRGGGGGKDQSAQREEDDDAGGSDTESGGGMGARTIAGIGKKITKMMLESDSESDGENEGQEEEEEETKETLQEASRFHFLERDMSKLLVLMITHDRQSLIRTDMNRFDLLEACRKPSSKGSVVRKGGEELVVALQLR